MLELTRLSQQPIMIVDDNPNNLKVLSQSLRNAGWLVAIAKSGEIALKQANHTPPALILLDVMMPGIDGFETCQRLKANPHTMDIPVIFMTALSDPIDKVKGLSVGAVDYITKPFQAEEVLARTNIHYKLRSLTKELREQNDILEQRVAERTRNLKISLEKLERTQIKLVQQEKMATLGNLVAGLGHEINNPVGLIFSNIAPIKEYLTNLLDAIRVYQEVNDDLTPEIEAEIEQLEIEFISEDFPKLIESIETAVKRLKSISSSLRIFSRADTAAKTFLDIHDGLDSTLLILKYRLKKNERRPKISIVKDYGKIPLIKCYAGQVNQVLMNLLANAIDALDEAVEILTDRELEANPKRITITTRVAEERAIIRIGDNGKGMTEEVMAKIFESSFTTKAVGKGTGLGLAISRQIIEEKHGGTIKCRSEVGKGTEFEIALPIS
ncbi:MAG: response regulator [Oscillatoria sp. SIO1A7]|nr:response regulator [Oscillatoria sp. SIO1A7]